MATSFDFRGGFADQAADKRQRSRKTPEKIDALIDWRPIEGLLAHPANSWTGLAGRLGPARRG